MIATPVDESIDALCQALAVDQTECSLCAVSLRIRKNRTADGEANRTFKLVAVTEVHRMTDEQ